MICSLLSNVREPQPLSPEAFEVFKKHLPPNARMEAEMRQAQMLREQERIERMQEQKLSEMLDEETFIRFGYVPFVIASLAWDYADTIMDLAKNLKLKETRPLCRAIRELKKSYDELRAPYIDMAHQNSEIDNMYVFEDGVKDVFNLFLENVAIDLRCEYSALDEEYIVFLKAVYQCHIVLQSLYEYVRQQSKIVEGIVKHSIGDILPKEIRKLDTLVLAFAGDKPISEKFSSHQKTYAKTLANRITSVELNEKVD